MYNKNCVRSGTYDDGRFSRANIVLASRRSMNLCHRGALIMIVIACLGWPTQPLEADPSADDLRLYLNQRQRQTAADELA